MGEEIRRVTYAHYTRTIPLIANSISDLNRKERRKFFLGKLSGNILPQRRVRVKSSFLRHPPRGDPFVDSSTSRSPERTITQTE